LSACAAQASREVLLTDNPQDAYTYPKTNVFGLPLGEGCINSKPSLYLLTP